MLGVFKSISSQKRSKPLRDEVSDLAVGDLHGCDCAFGALCAHVRPNFRVFFQSALKARMKYDNVVRRWLFV